MIRLYNHESSEYMQELALRNKVLRKPLGMNLYNEDLSQDKRDIHIGFFSSGRLVGCLLLSKIDDTTVKMRQVAVDDVDQRNGIGSRIVSFAEDWAKRNGYKKITMHARKMAVGFYTKLGYKMIGDEFEEISIPHYKMDKKLL